MKKSVPFLVILLATLLLLVACVGSGREKLQPTLTVEEAKALGYSMYIEPCSNRVVFPDLYIGVPILNLGSNRCEMYFSPEYMEATESCLDQFQSGTFQEYVDCATEALSG